MTAFVKRVKHFFLHNQICGLLSMNQIAACHPHGLLRKGWGLSHYGLKPGRNQHNVVPDVSACNESSEAKHSVVIESLNHHASMWECMLWCALRSVVCCASPMVCGLSFLGMSRTCPSFHDCGIHTCPSFQIITNPLTTSVHILPLNI